MKWIKWIKISERLPDEGRRVLVYDGYDMHVSRGVKLSDKFEFNCYHGHELYVTHWMYVPNNPEIKNELDEKDALEGRMFSKCGPIDRKNPIMGVTQGNVDWKEFLQDNHCSLCGNYGVIDTIGLTTPAGIKVGRLNYCICPNGKEMKESEIPLLSHNDMEEWVKENLHHFVIEFFKKFNLKNDVEADV